MRNAIAFGLVIVLLSGSVILASNILHVHAEPETIVVPDDYPSIQEAINAATDGDIVFVRGGVYHEEVVVTKAISLVGESPNAVIELSGEGGEKIGILIAANYATVKGLTIRGRWELDNIDGIRAVASYMVVERNIVENTTYGIDVSSQSVVKGNTVTGSHRAVILGSGNTIEHNVIRHNFMA